MVQRPSGITIASTMIVGRNDLENGIRPTQVYLNNLARNLVKRTRSVRVNA